MKKRLKWLIPLILIILVTVLYLWPASEPSFEELYADVDQETVDSLAAFRNDYPTKTVLVNDKPWDYLALGQGENTIVFLHGMTGAYDIWWQQMEVLQERYRVISMTYPAAESLNEMAGGVMAILEAEGVNQVHLVGSSLGGYFAQYLVANYPDKINSAVLANTFPPNNLIA